MLRYYQKRTTAQSNLTEFKFYVTPKIKLVITVLCIIKLTTKRIWCTGIWKIQVLDRGHASKWQVGSRAEGAQGQDLHD